MLRKFLLLYPVSKYMFVCVWVGGCVCVCVWVGGQVCVCVCVCKYKTIRSCMCCLQGHMYISCLLCNCVHFLNAKYVNQCYSLHC